MIDLSSGIAFRFTRLVALQKGVDFASVSPQDSFMDDLGFDSLDSVELAMAVENEFGVKVTDADEERLARVCDYIQFIEQAKPVRHLLSMVA